jgi:hypothetical protein
VRVVLTGLWGERTASELTSHRKLALKVLQKRGPLKIEFVVCSGEWN